MCCSHRGLSCWWALAGKKGKAGGKKGSCKLVLTPETERLLTHTCVCLEFLVAGDNADCYTLAAYGCLPPLVQLAADSKNTQLRRAAKVSPGRQHDAGWAVAHLFGSLAVCSLAKAFHGLIRCPSWEQVGQTGFFASTSSSLF